MNITPMDRKYDSLSIGSKNLSLTKGTVYVIEGAAQIRLKKSRCFSIMEPWQKQESDRMSAIHEKGGRCH